MVCLSNEYVCVCMCVCLHLLQTSGGENALLFSPHLNEDCSRPPTKHVASLSLLAFYCFHSGQSLAQLAQARASLEAQMARAARAETLPGELAKLIESAGYAQSQVASSQADKLRIASAFLARRLRACDEARRGKLESGQSACACVEVFADESVRVSCLFVLCAHEQRTS